MSNENEQPFAVNRLQERAAWVFNQDVLTVLYPLFPRLDVRVEVTHNLFSLLLSVPFKGQFHLQNLPLNSVMNQHFLVPMWFARRICSFALTVVAHLGNISMHEWHTPCGKAVGSKIVLPYKLHNFAQNLKVAHYWKKHTVLKMAELENHKNSHYLLNLMSF